MLKIVKGDLIKSETEALVNTVNTVGVMGKGIALQFRQAFPNKYFQDYQKACQHNEIEIGKMHVYETGSLTNPRFIINFPTKAHWKGKSKIEDIRAGLVDLIRFIREKNIKSISIPPLGCGNGGLLWSDVRPLIEEAFSALSEVEVLLHTPDGAPRPEEMKISTRRPDLTVVRAAMISLFEIYLLPGYSLSILEVQKLAYLLQASGELLGLNFTKEKYGPYAGVLEHVLQKIEGHYTRGYGDRSKKVIEPTMVLLPDAATLAKAYLQNESPETLERLERVFNLIEGFEYPHGMELLSTVHWVAQEDAEAKNNVTKAVEAIHAWSERKRKNFSEREIEIAWQRLKDCSYI